MTMHWTATTTSIRTYAFAITLSLALLGALAILWNSRGPNPDHAFIAIMIYFSVLALIIACNVICKWVDRTSTPLQEPPIARSPARLPVGPRRPAPLVARAKAPSGL